MENKDQNNTVPVEGVSSGAQPSVYGVVREPPPNPDALSLDPSTEPFIPQEQPKSKANVFLRFARRLDVILAVLLLVAGAVVLFSLTRKDNANDAKSSASNSFGTVEIPLGAIIEGKDLTLSGIANVTINGMTQLSGGLRVAPSLQPTGAVAGQIYYDQGTNQLAYFNGDVFVFLTSAGVTPGGVQSLGGATGLLTVGDGLNIANNQLANTGVLSVQGQAGNISLTAGPGIIINGTNFSNSGVISVASGSPNVSVANDGSGNVTLSVTSGAGTITSSGGTAGTIPIYTASQNIEDSIVTQSGLTVTVSGDLSIVTGGLTLSNALTVSNGGTGTTSLSNNGVLIGNGTAAITAVASGAPGLCLLSTAGAPTWAACPSGSGVTSLNGLTGALNIANASAAGSTVTIDDASTVNKGIASFNSTNFTAVSGTVNTVQNINTGATPTFAGVNTNTITPSAALTVGISTQTALLQGSTTTITSNGGGNNIVLNSAATIELQDDTNVAGNVAISGDLAVNGGDITSAGALNITPGGALTIGASSQALTLQGGATSSFRATSGANTTIVAFTSPTANTTLNFPALAAGTYTICTTSGNCAGASATLQSAYDNSTDPEIVLDATRGALSIRDNATPLGANLLEVQNNAGSATYLAVTAAGIAVTGTATVSSHINSSTGGLQTAGTTRIDNSGNLINIAAITASGSATFQGGVATLGTAAQAGSVVLHDGSSNTGTLQIAALGQDTIYTLPDPGAGTATICLSSGNCAGSGGGVTTGGGTLNRLAKFTGAQAIGDSSISDDGTDVTVSVDVIIQGGDLTVGATSQAASMVLHDGNGQTTTLQSGDSAGNMIFILPTNTGIANQCLKQSGVGNQLVWQDCDGGAGGSSATLQTAYDNSTLNPEITLNSSVGGITIRDNSTPIGSVLFNVQNNLGTTTYLEVSVSGISVDGSATIGSDIDSSGGAIQTNSVSRIDNSGNMINIGNITGTGAITVASVGAGNDITIDGADQFIIQDTSVFNALSTFNANIDLGANDIVGTTGNINLTNFDVAGATGNVTAGTYNGQTISSSANFTGTVAVVGNTTLTGDVAVNGGDITSTGALNIMPTGTLTVGVTGQQLILQGSANTQLTATGGGFTTTVGFAGTPVAAVTYNFDRAAAAGTYTICTTVGNCAGSGGGVTTLGGTTGTLPKFTGAQTLGDSLLSESGSTMTVNGNLNLVTGNQFQINGTQISSANLSNDANLAKLSASQTFTGNTVAFQNTINSVNAFAIQNQAGNRILAADTTNGQILLGLASTLDGRLVFNNMSNANTVTILPGTPTAPRTLTLPDASGIICTDSGNCAGAGATLQTSYNFSVGGTTPKIKVNSSLGAVDIQDADTPIGANLFNIRESNAAGLGSVMFGVGNTGQVTLQNAANSTTAFRLLTQGGTSVLTGDTTNGAIILGQSGTLSGSLVFNNATNANTTTIALATPSAPRTITLPNATGTVCLDSGNCSGAGSSNTLQAAYDAGNTILSSNARDISFALADTATDSNFLIDLQCDTTCGVNGRFAIQDDGTDVFSVAPVTGEALFRNSIDSIVGFRVQDAAGTSTLLNIDTQNGRVGIGGVASFSKFEVIDGEAAIYNNGNNARLVLGDSTTAGQNGYLQWDSTNDYFRIESVGTNGLKINDNFVTIGNIFPDQPLKVASGSTLLAQVNTTGQFMLQNTTDSATAFRVLNASGSRVATVDTTTGELELGEGSVVGGRLAFHNATNNNTITLVPATATSNQTVTLPDATGVVCLESAASCGFVTGSTGDYIQNTTVQQTANINILSAAAGNIGARFEGAANQSAQVVLVRAGTNASNDTFEVQNSTGGQTFAVDTVNTRVKVGGAVLCTTGRFCVSQSTTGSTGTITNMYNVQSAVTTGAVNIVGHNVIVNDTSSSIANTIRPFIIDTSGTTNTSAIIESIFIDIPSNASGNFMRLQNGASDVFTIANSGDITATGTYNTNTFTANTLQFGAAGTATIQSAASQALTITSNAGATWSTSSGDLGIQAAGALNIGNAGGTAINIGTNAGAHTIQIGTGAAVQTVVIGSTNTSSTTTIQAGTGGLILSTNSASASITAKSSTNGTTAFQVLNATDVPMFVIDTTTGAVKIGGGDISPSTTPGLLVLDHKSSAGDPTGTNGGMYYNASSGKMRCYENGVWKNCLGLDETITLFGQNGAGASSVWTNQPAALTELMMASGPVSNPASRTKYDLTSAEQVRFIVNCETGGATNAEIRIQYSTDQTTWNYLDAAGTGLGQNIDLPGTDVSAWANIAAGAKGDVFLRMVGINGDGANDPTLGLIQLQVR